MTLALVTFLVILARDPCDPVLMTLALVTLVLMTLVTLALLTLVTLSL